MRAVWVIVLTLLLAAPAAAQVQAPAKPQTKSLDSEAPPGSPPHWLPNETWVMQHWLPYDETRLYSLLGVTRGDVWRWLRDDTRNLAGLAAGGRELFPLYHPAAAMYNQTLKGTLFEDARSLGDRLRE